MGQLTANEAIRVKFDWMARSHMAEVLQIEQDSFEFPWRYHEDFVRALSRRNCLAEVAQYEGRVLGFMVYELHKTQYHVLNFAVAADCRRNGVGRQMLSKLVAKLSPLRRSRIVLEVREMNLGAQLFLRECKVRAVRVLRGFYEDTPEDAYVMVYRMPPRQGLGIRGQGPENREDADV